jgi:hypothetical protein
MAMKNLRILGGINDIPNIVIANFDVLKKFKKINSVITLGLYQYFLFQ